MLSDKHDAIEILRAMVDKLDVILPKVDAIIAFQTVRSGQQAYDGPNLIEEMKAAKELLAPPTPADGAPQEPKVKEKNLTRVDIFPSDSPMGSTASTD